MITKNISDFEENEIYKVVLNDITYYFKFKCIDFNGCLDFYWEIVYKYFYEKNNNSVSFSFEIGIYEKIDISDIIKYLPNDNIDRINYFRKQRIKNLLNES